MEQPVRTAIHLLLMLAAASSAMSQDLASVMPKAVKVEYEDDRIRVVHLRVAPHESVPMHERPARVVIPLATSDVAMPRADGTIAKVRSTAGEAGWGGPTRRSFTNRDAPVDNIIVDLKKTDAPAKPVAGPPTPMQARSIDERFHHWRFENQYVRVYDLRIPPGATTGFYAYPSEAVVVVVSGGMLKMQERGKAWGRSHKVDPGLVEVSDRGKQDRRRRLRNRGPAEYHAVVIQLPQ